MRSLRLHCLTLSAIPKAIRMRWDGTTLKLGDFGITPVRRGLLRHEPGRQQEDWHRPHDPKQSEEGVGRPPRHRQEERWAMTQHTPGRSKNTWSAYWLDHRLSSPTREINVTHGITQEAGTHNGRDIGDSPIVITCNDALFDVHLISGDCVQARDLGHEIR